MIEQLGMAESVPGTRQPRCHELVNADVASPALAARYNRGPAPPCDARMRSAPQCAATVETVYGVKTLGAASGFISTVFDYGKFDVAPPHTESACCATTRWPLRWTAPVNDNGVVLPHATAGSCRPTTASRS